MDALYYGPVVVGLFFFVGGWGKLA